MLMPYPHGFTRLPAAEGELASILRELGFRVITFDPPGAFRSTRAARVCMPEMLDCVRETVDSFGIETPFCVVGHSMGGLCAIAYALENPELVSRLVLIGTVSGGPAIARGKGMPWCLRPTDADFWRFIVWGLQLTWGHGDLRMHKKLVQLLWRHSYVDKGLIPRIEVLPEDGCCPAPARDIWPRIVRNIDYCGRLEEIKVPALVAAGRMDPQAPVACSKEIAQGLPGARLALFERSGHYPFIEERERFTNVLSDFLKSD